MPKATVSPQATIPSIIRRYRGERTLEAFADELNTTRQAIWNIEDSRNTVGDRTLQLWCEDDREWVRNLARDILVVKYRRVLEEFFPGDGNNGHPTDH